MSPAEEPVNSEIFLWALHLLGGDSKVLDVEDVFLKCFELAPKRFSWRTRLDIPDYKRTSKALREAEAKWPGFFVKTPDGLGRQLTVEGQHWISANARRLEASLGPGRRVQEPKTRPSARMLSEVERGAVFVQWLGDHTLPEEKWRIAELLKCSPDSSTRIWDERLETLRAAAHAAERKELLEFLDQIKDQRPAWFGRE